jgi:hypothetical protein
MLESEEQRSAKAAAATEEQITLYVHDPSSRVVITLLENRNITEEHVLIIAGRKNLPGRVLDRIFKDRRWTESYRVRLALAKNPKTPMFSALSIARYLRLFDLAELARNHFLPILYRKKIESIVIEKIPTLALGVKKTLAKTASGEILLFLIQDGYPDVVRTCLDNPHMVEASLYKVINRATSTPGTIRTIAEHRNWTSRYHIKYALVRNQHTPLSRSVLFLRDIKTRDLKDLYRDPLLPSGIRPSIHRELVERGEDPDALNVIEEETVFEITDGEIDEFEREMNTRAGNHDDREPPHESSADNGSA